MTTASVKLTADEMYQLRNDAKARRMTISDYLRAALAAMKPKPRAPRWKITGTPGCVVIKWPQGTPPITDAMMKAEEEKYDLEALQ